MSSDPSAAAGAQQTPPCKYCEKSLLPLSMRPVATLAASDVLLLEDTRFIGRCIVAARWHVRELFDLSPEQRDAFMADVSNVARTVQRLVAADKINLGFYGDLSDHLHAHVVPKWRHGSHWGDAFPLQPAPDSSPPTGAPSFGDLVQQLRAALQG